VFITTDGDIQPCYRLLHPSSDALIPPWLAWSEGWWIPGA